MSALRRSLGQYQILVKVCVGPIHSAFCLISFYLFEENNYPRRSDRANKGQGGALERMQADSDAIHAGQSTRKRKRTHVQNIPESAVANPMAPVPAKRTRQRKADVCLHNLSTLILTIGLLHRRLSPRYHKAYKCRQSLSRFHT